LSEILFLKIQKNSFVYAGPVWNYSVQQQKVCDRISEDSGQLSSNLTSKSSQSPRVLFISAQIEPAGGTMQLQWTLFKCNITPPVQTQKVFVGPMFGFWKEIWSLKCQNRLFLIIREI